MIQRRRLVGSVWGCDGCGGITDLSPVPDSTIQRMRLVNGVGEGMRPPGTNLSPGHYMIQTRLVDCGGRAQIDCCIVSLCPRSERSGA